MSCRCILTFSLVAFCVLFSAQATVYRPGLHQVRFTINSSTKNFDRNRDVSTLTEYDDYCLGLFTNSKVSKNGSSTNPITGKAIKWGEYAVYVYEGEIYLDSDRTYVIGGAFDDGSAILIGEGGDEFTWDQGSETSGSNAQGYQKAGEYKPETSGWRKVRLLLWNWTSGAGPTTTYGLQWRTDGETSYSADGWNNFADAGDASFLRVKIADTYMLLNGSELSDGTCRVNLTSLAPYRSTFSLVLDGETEPIASVEVESGADATLEFPWEGVGTPLFRIKVHGVDPAFLSNGDYYEESELVSFTFDRQTVVASASELTGTSATIAFTSSYIFAYDGAEYPAVEHYLAWGVTDAGTNSEGWDHFYMLEGDGMDAIGPHTVQLTDLAENGVYAVRVAVKRPDGELFWSESVPVILSAVNLTAPSIVYENSLQTYSLVVMRTGDAAEVDEPIVLSYQGDKADFIGLQEVIVIPAGETTASMPFTMKDNDEKDGNRKLTVSLVQGCLMGESKAVEIVVADDESATPAVCVWTGASSDLKWETPGNWKNDRVPQILDTAKFTSDYVKANQQIAVSALQEISTLEIDVGVAFKIVDGGAGQLNLSKIIRHQTDSKNVHNVTVPLWFYTGPEGYAEVEVETNQANTFSIGDFTGVCDVVKTGPGQLNLSPSKVNDFRDYQVVIKDGTLYSNPANSPNSRLAGMTFVLDNTEHDVMLWFGNNEHKTAFTVRNTGGDHLSTYKHDGGGHTFSQNWDFRGSAYMELNSCNFSGSLQSMNDVRMAVTGGNAKFGGGAVDVDGKLILEKGTISFQDNQNGTRTCATEYVLGNENTKDDDTLQLGLGNKTDYPANGANTIHVTNKGKSVAIYRAGNYKRNNTRLAPIVIDRDVTFKCEETNAGYGDTYTGVISGVGGVTIKTSTASYLKLAAQNTYAGGTLVTENAKCRVGSNGAFGTGDVIVESEAVITYSGMTADEKGEVDAVSDKAKLILDEGAVIDFGTLNAAETVGKLIVNGGSLPPGIYGALESGAQHEVSFVTGDGRLNVKGGLAILFR